MKRLKNFNLKSVLILGSVLGGVSAIYFGVPSMNSVTYVSDYQDVLATETVPPEEPIEEIKEIAPPPIIVTHIKTPDQVKGIYMSQCVVGTPSFRERLVKLIDTPELNSVIIDIRDYTGKNYYSCLNFV